jgi:hypothetical protein
MMYHHEYPLFYGYNSSDIELLKPEMTIDEILYYAPIVLTDIGIKASMKLIEHLRAGMDDDDIEYVSAYGAIANHIATLIAYHDPCDPREINCECREFIRTLIEYVPDYTSCDESIYNEYYEFGYVESPLNRWLNPESSLAQWTFAKDES